MTEAYFARGLNGWAGDERRWHELECE